MTEKIVESVTFMAIVAVIVLLTGLVVWVLWNWLMPELFWFPELTYWQTVGLLALLKLLYVAVVK